MDPSPPTTKYGDDMQIHLCYATQGFPINIGGQADLRVYEHFVSNPPGILIPNGTAARVVDFAPGYTTPMHRSSSFNYNFVIEGEVEIILDSGETRILKPGDCLVQRDINHAWRNVSETRWARITAVVLPVNFSGAEEHQISEE